MVLPCAATSVLETHRHFFVSFGGVSAIDIRNLHEPRSYRSGALVLVSCAWTCGRGEKNTEDTGGKHAVKNTADTCSGNGEKES